MNTAVLSKSHATGSTVRADAVHRFTAFKMDTLGIAYRTSLTFEYKYRV